MKQPHLTGSLHVEWRDQSWQPRVVKQTRRGARLDRREAATLLTWRQPCRAGGAGSRQDWRRFGRRAFTLIELLVVISIIAVLAGLLLPVLGGMKKRARIATANHEAKSLESAFYSYYRTYSKFPLSRRAEQEATMFYSSGPLGDWPPDEDAMFSPTNYATQNMEAMTILLNKADPIINPNGVRNPQNRVDYEPGPAKFAGGPGLGADNIMRDPWGSPYRFAVDFNEDDHVDLPPPYGHAAPPTSIRSVQGKVMVWSIGPDTKSENDADGEDDIKTSWEAK